MPIDWRTRWVALFGLAVLAALLTPAIPGRHSFTPARAAPDYQEGIFPYAKLSPLVIENFPRIHTYLEVFDSGGSFASGLTAGDIRIVENGQSQPVTEMEELNPGVQFVLAATFGPAMGIRDGLGRSRYDYLLENLATWEWSTDPHNPDDLSVIIDSGPEVVHQNDPSSILRRLMDFTPDPRQSVPNLQTLSRAIEIALDPVDRPGMHRAVLFITPPLEADAIAGLQGLVTQASQGGVRVFIWLIGAADAMDTPAVQQMQALAIETGGQFLNYSGVEDLPHIEAYLGPLRHTYQLAYTSKAASSGTYTVQAVIQQDGLDLESEPRTFVITIQAPNPVFMALPSHILRRAVQEEKLPQPENLTTKGADGAEGEVSETNVSETAIPGAEPPDLVLLPEEKELQVLVEFPDGYQRPLAESLLLVDGVVVWRNQRPPFDTFLWDLRPYTEDGQHFVQVVISDILGLQGASTALPVEISVEGIPIPLSERFSGRGLWVGGVAVLVVATVVGLVLVLGGRVQPYGAHRNIFSRTKLAPGARSRPSPGSPDSLNDHNQPASGEDRQTAPGLPGWINRFTRRGSRSSAKALAYLVPITDSEATSRETPVALYEGETILGRDPRQVTRAFSDPALEAVHSRLYLKEGRFHLYDSGTTAGTWVNFNAVPEAGVILRHGDLVHIGRVAFRFTTKDSKDARKPVIIPVEQTRDQA